MIEKLECGITLFDIFCHVIQIEIVCHSVCKLLIVCHSVCKLLTNTNIFIIYVLY